MKRICVFLLFIIQSAFADTVLMSNVPNGCSSDFNSNTHLLATFSRNQYQCNSGYYVPANYDGCVLCPDVYDCNGGSFIFNEEYDQGNKFKVQITGNIANGCKEDFLRAYNNAANITATFTPNVHNCSAGYYLPANIDECRKCLANNYCPGGNLTFNETTPQGIIECPSNHPFAPAGMWQQSQCGRKLHVGNDTIYLHQSPANPTAHRLFVQHENTVYSANATTTPTPITAGSQHYLKVMYNDVEYYICDDTTLR